MDEVREHDSAAIADLLDRRARRPTPGPKRSCQSAGTHAPPGPVGVGKVGAAGVAGEQSVTGESSPAFVATILDVNRVGDALRGMTWSFDGDEPGRPYLELVAVLQFHVRIAESSWQPLTISAGSLR